MNRFARLIRLILLLCLSLSAVWALDPSDRLRGLTDEQKERITQFDTLWAEGLRESSLVVIDSLLRKTDEESYPRFRAHLLCKSGMRLLFFGRALEAEPKLREGLDLAWQVDDTLLICSCLRWYCVSRGRQGEPLEAHEDYQELLNLARQSGDTMHEGWAQVGVAYQASRKGRSEESIESYGRAIQLFEQIDEVEGKVWAENGLGLALSNAQQYRTALNHFRHAAELAHELNQHYVETMALNNIGSIEYSLGDPGVALKAFEASLALSRQMGNQRAAIKPAINVALCHRYLGRYDLAAEILKENLQTCREQNYRNLGITVLNHLAALKNAQGRPREAIRYCEEILALGEQVPLQSRIKGLFVLAGAYGKIENLDAALEYAQLAMQELKDQPQHELWPQTNLLMGERLIALNRKHEALEHLISGTRSAAHIGQNQYKLRGLGFAAGLCLEFGDRVRAGELLEEAVHIWEEDRRVPMDPDWRRIRGESANDIQTVLAEYILQNPDKSEKERAIEAFDRLQRFKARTLQERMLGPGQGQIEAIADTSFETATCLLMREKVLHPGELFFDLYMGKTHSYIFGLSSGDCRVVELPHHYGLHKQLGRYIELLSNPGSQNADTATHQALKAAGHEISRMLFGEFREMIESHTRIIIAPDGVTNMISFVQLPLDTLEARNREWVRVPSATVLYWMRTGESKQLTEQNNILAIAGRETESGEPLPGAAVEVHHLAERYHDVEVLVLPDSEISFEPSILTKCSILHLASHAHLDDQNPWQSSLYFGRADEPPRLLAAEIAKLNLQARLVVLSSCGSAAGRTFTGEGVQSLTSAFLSTGVPVVLATLWPVDDAVTTSLMAEFYESLANDETVSAALSSAQDVIRSREETSHPFYWAGFVLVGDGDTRLELDTRGMSWRYRILCIFVFALLLAIILWRWFHRRIR